jgi:uncharacterized protein
MRSTSHDTIGPVRGPERIDFLDALRGFALAGVLLANLELLSGYAFLSSADQAALPSAAADNVVGSLLFDVFVENKFLGLFALLFGLGFSLQLDRARSRGAELLPTFRRRLGWLFAFGVAHAWLLWWGDILRFYAVWGLLLPLFAARRPRTLLVWGLLLGVVLPAAWRVGISLAASAGSVSAKDAAGESLEAATLAAFAEGTYLDVLRANWTYSWRSLLSATQGPYQLAIFGRFLLGMWIGRMGLFHDIEAHRVVLRRIAAWSLGVGLIGNGVFAAIPLLQEMGLLGYPRWLAWRFVVTYPGFLALTMFYACGLALLWLRDDWRERVELFAPVGRMALTNYVLQSVCGVWLFYGFTSGPRLMGQFGPSALIPVWAAVFAAQVVMSHLWLRQFRCGPCEWLWRMLTYGRVEALHVRSPRRAPVPGAAAGERVGV